MHDNTVWTTSTPVVVPRCRTVATTTTSCYSFLGGGVVVVSKRYHRQSTISLTVILMMMMDAAARARHRDGIEVCTIPTTTKKTSEQKKRITRSRWNIEERIFTSGYLNTKRNNDSLTGKGWHRYMEWSGWQKSWSRVLRFSRVQESAADVDP